jgi:hypothetical protein
MADVQTYDVDAKLTPVNGRAQMVKFGNHGKHIILM